MNKDFCSKLQRFMSMSRIDSITIYNDLTYHYDSDMLGTVDGNNIEQFLNAVCYSGNTDKADIRILALENVRLKNTLNAALEQITLLREAA